MRLSCNGCRVLRKGCSEGCTFRPCLQWIKSAEGQANATVFLAKFYGRAGLVNLINAGPEHLRPAVFRSLLYEACGRIVNPIYGSVGLLWSGSWQLCQAAVEAVLKGAPITKISSDSAASAAPLPNFKAIADIRHVAKNPHDLRSLAAKSRPRFKRSAGGPSSTLLRRSARREAEEESQENGSAVSGDTAEGSHVSQSKPEAAAPADVGLKLWLGPEPEGRNPKAEAEAEPKEEGTGAWAEDACRLELGLRFAAA